MLLTRLETRSWPTKFYEGDHWRTPILKVVRAVAMLAGLPQLENSNFEAVLRRRFNAFNRDAYGFVPTQKLRFWKVWDLLQVGYRWRSIRFPTHWNKNSWRIYCTRYWCGQQSFRMPASKLSVPKGLRYTIGRFQCWRPYCAQGFLLWELRAGFHFPLLRYPIYLSS